ncbi:MAG: methyltransferase [Acholeplasmatales bacterium]|jgi:tRNA1Val (adenine37-N6)-methyltransferase|nr:methyltransferase [Acholeplasmatales bacterium]
MKRELINSKFIYEYSHGQEFNIDTIILASFINLKNKDKKILDIGCGAGALLLYIASYPNIEITGIEIQESRCIQALNNIKINNLENKIKIINEDIKKLDITSKFDYIVSNPPFFLVNNRNKEITERKIAREELFLTLEELLYCTSVHLNNKGTFVFIYPVTRLNEVFVLLNKYKLTPKTIRFIYPNISSSPNRILIESIKDAKNELKVLPPLILYKDNQDISDELVKIYGSNIKELNK